MGRRSGAGRSSGRGCLSSWNGARGGGFWYVLLLDLGDNYMGVYFIIIC